MRFFVLLCFQGLHLCYSSKDCEDRKTFKSSESCLVPKEERVDPIGKQFSKILSPENKLLLVKKGEEKKQNRFFLGELSEEDIIVNDLWQKIKTLPCREGCGVFDSVWKYSFDKMVQLFVNLESSEAVEHDLETFMQICNDIFEKIYTYTDEKVNEHLVKSAQVKALSLRNDTQDVHIDPTEIFPALKTTNVKKGSFFRSGNQQGEIPWEQLQKYPSRVSGLEQKVDYFREDENLHVFHNTYHTKRSQHRIYEHFYYMHRMYIFRYFTERDTEGLPAVIPLDKSRRNEEFISEYSISLANDPFSNLMRQFSSNKPRCRFSPYSLWQIDRKEQACFSQPKLQDIEIFGRECEDYHNIGHTFLSQECVGANEKRGIMDSSLASGRDPLFHRWHLAVDQSYTDYLNAQRPYSPYDVLPPQGITLNSAMLTSRCKLPNQVETFWRRVGDKYELDHMQYNIQIGLLNKVRSTEKVIFRVFLVKEKFVDDNRFYFELDRFTQRLNGATSQIISRLDDNSSAFWKTRDECGWPRNLALPKGKSQAPEKYRLIVFVHSLSNPNVNEGELLTPTLMCGDGTGRITMDHRAFGFPMERKWTGIDKLNVINNKDSSFGQISSTVEIINRGLNPSSCADAKFFNGK